MARPEFTAPKGTKDVLPPESTRWEALVARFAGQVRAAGYGLLQGPMFEELGVFQRMGEGTDVVRKEMYDFTDKGGRHVALRPEGTAGVARAFVEHRPTTPFKIWYAAPNFRYEAPQTGRLRQHHQLGVEALGAEDPDIDAEVVVLLADFYRSLGLRRVRLAINSIGAPADRERYVAALREHLRRHRRDLHPEDQEKVDRNPMRVLDTKRPESRAVVDAAPSVLERLGPDAARRFDRVQAGLRAAGVAFELDPLLVRGLDYYTHTTFEFQALALDAAQRTIGGGGRYDGLVEALGGPATPGVGFGSGIERTLLACDAEGVFTLTDVAAPLDAFVVDVTDGTVARDLTLELRRAGLGADRSYGNRSMKAQMRAADRSGARHALIVGEEEARTGTVTLRDLEAGTQVTLDRSEAVSRLRAGQARPA